MNLPILFAAAAALALPASAQKMQTATGEAPGPWLLGTVGVGKGGDATTPKTTEAAGGTSGSRQGGRVALKGLAIKVGEKGEAAVAYDLDLCRMVGAWTGKFTTPMNLMSRGEYPTAMGEVAFTTGEVPGFLVADAKEPWKDPRPEPFGPLPPGQARFKGFYVNGDKTIIKWDLGGTEVLEMPGYEQNGGFAWFERTFLVPPHKERIRVPLCELARQPEQGTSSLINGSDVEDGETRGDADNEYRLGITTAVIGVHRIDFRNTPAEFATFGRGALNKSGTSVWLDFEPSTDPTRLRVSLWEGAREKVAAYRAARFRPSKRVEGAQAGVDDLSRFVAGGPARWPEPVVTQGELAKDTDAAYVVDTIKLPDPNPSGAPMFTSGFDFFEDGRAAVCTFHGDVFVVSGIDERLEKVTWRRFASGLYHPLGLKIVKGEIYVACRDGLWRLNDLNRDGECDFYEAFNFDLKVTKNFHEFVFDLQTDPAGNFYFAKAGPVKNGGRGFDQIMDQHGSLFRVSPDGAKLERIATGFRAPNGIGVGPHGELTSGDNEGTWMPACKINWIQPGGFYGVVDLAHRTPPPTDYDRPLCWLPKRIDNSGGGQVWVPEGERWGPWGGKMLHLSYGQSSLYGVLAEQIGRQAPRLPAAGAGGAPALQSGVALMQGGVVKFPLQFQSGIMRARFNPKDGQLYVMGLRGWQTNGLKNGCFQRVRFTGAVPRMPVEMHVKKDGIQLRFACSLDTQAAADPQNWNIEQWRYLWSEAYGSAEYSAEGDSATAEKKHDPVTVKSVAIGTDDRTVFLEIPGLKPVMQMAIKYDLKTVDGQELRGEVVNTIHALGAE